MSSKLYILPRNGYDQWSTSYDIDPNPTLAIDDAHFPIEWRHLINSEVLEIGCGTGRHTEKLLSLGNRVVGVDVSPGMLAVARRKLAGKPIQLLEVDFMTYEGFEGKKFDAAVSSLVLEHIENIPLFFSKLSSLIKSRGEFFLSEIHPFRAAQGNLAYFKENGSQKRIYLNSFAHKEETIESAATAAGFHTMSSRDVSGDHALVSIHPEWGRYLGQPMIKIWSFKRL